MENLDQILKDNEKVLIDFYADWCGPCRMLSPIVEEIKNERKDVKVIKINVDENPQLAGAYGVRSIPTLVYIKDGKLANQMIGVRPKKDILSMIQ
ncbi:MAG: thioredoxin [Bacilli bacterium]